MNLSSGRDKLLQFYYLGTPLFLLGDYFGGMSIRVSAFDEQPGLKFGYYALCFGFGLLSIAKPLTAAVAGLFESAINLVLLALTVLPIYNITPEDIESGHLSYEAFCGGTIINFIISGAVLLISFYANPIFALWNKEQ